MGFHYAANGAKVRPIYRDMYRQVSNQIQNNSRQLKFMNGICKQRPCVLKGTHGFKLIPSGPRGLQALPMTQPDRRKFRTDWNHTASPRTWMPQSFSTSSSIPPSRLILMDCGIIGYL